MGLAFKAFKDFAGREFGDRRRELFGENRTVTQSWRDTGEAVFLRENAVDLGTAWVLWTGQREELTLAPKVQMGRGAWEDRDIIPETGSDGLGAGDGKQFLHLQCFQETQPPTPAMVPMSKLPRALGLSWVFVCFAFFLCPSHWPEP